MGFPPLAAAIVALIYNSVPVCYGAVGTPTNSAFAVVSESVTNLGHSAEDFLSELTFFSAVNMAVGAFVIITLGIIILVTMFGKDAEHRKVSKAFEVFPFIVFVAVVFDVVYLIIARFIGPELVSCLLYTSGRRTVAV